MKTILMVLLAIDMLAVVAVMLTGAIGIANKDRNPRFSNKLMRWRVMLQATAVVLVVALMLTG